MTYGRPIKELRLVNFKAFETLQLKFDRLTVLTGTNSSGKSSVMQAIALLEQSRDQDPAGLVLNGELVEIGTYEDVLFDRIKPTQSSDQPLEISIRNGSGTWMCVRGSAALMADFVEAYAPADLLEWVPSWQHFAYIRADRLGPTLIHQKSHTAVVRDNSVGSRGEYTVHFLMSHGDNPVRKPMLVKGFDPRLGEQTGAWLERISSNTRFYVSEVAGTGSATLRFSNGKLTGLGGREHRSTNVGFGLSYALPVVVACLASGPGDLILVENPEAHLHPRAQAVLADLCVKAVRAGAQVIVETHSDHVLNRFRLAVAEEDLRPAELAIYFFAQDSTNSSASCRAVAVDRAGRYSDWPDGFFDEYVNAMLSLAEHES